MTVQSYLSAIEHGRNEVGAEVLLAISREFGKSLEWPLTGEEEVSVIGHEVYVLTSTI
jgi:transcriptional regulator with XRE-family HTH domain